MFEVGKFQHGSALEIHTSQAKKLIEGSGKSSPAANSGRQYSIFGIRTYGLFLIKIWSQVRADDPYAEMALMEVERRIDNAFSLINKLNAKLDTRVKKNALTGITIDLYTSKQPAMIQLNTVEFTTTHAKLGARLIGIYDLFMRKLITCKCFGIINSATFDKYKFRSSKVIRGVFEAPIHYRKLNVNRNDIINKTHDGLDAINTLGPIPMDVLERRIQSEFGPRPSSSFTFETDGS